jgi:hypothetical protein
MKSALHSLISFLPFLLSRLRLPSPEFDSVIFLCSKVLLSLSLSIMLRSTISRPVCLGIKHPSGAYDQILISVRPLRGCWCRALSLKRGRVCHLQLLLVLASAVIFGPESRGTCDHIFLYQIRNFRFRLLLQLAGLRWRYSGPPLHGIFFIITLHRPRRKHSLSIIEKACFQRRCITTEVTWLLLAYSLPR